MLIWYFQENPDSDRLVTCGNRRALRDDADTSSHTSGSNLGPDNAELIATVEERRTQVAEFNGVPEADVPADAVTASGSGLDPDISPAYAQLQVQRVAEARGLSVDDVRALVNAHTHGPDLGVFGQARVNVVQLNLALDELGR